jgi:hypothetical protein
VQQEQCTQRAKQQTPLNQPLSRYFPASARNKVHGSAEKDWLQATQKQQGCTANQ